jgi:hypothetical protein
VPRPDTARLPARIAAFAVGLALVLAVPQASAVTIGQLAPTATEQCNQGPYDFIQPFVDSGAGYEVPATGGIGSWTLTSWSTNATPDTGQMVSLKIFRKTTEPSTYRVIAHEGPHSLAPGLNQFAADVKVEPGDFLGLNWNGPPAASGACTFFAPGSVYDFLPGDLADGANAEFLRVDDEDLRVNISAEVTPTGEFTLGQVEKKRNGTATLEVTVPNPGDLTVAGKGVKGSPASAATQVGAGAAKLVIRAKGKKKKKLLSKGRVKVVPAITFTPTGGTASSQTTKVKLRRR